MIDWLVIAYKAFPISLPTSLPKVDQNCNTISLVYLSSPYIIFRILLGNITAKLLCKCQHIKFHKFPEISMKVTVEFLISIKILPSELNLLNSTSATYWIFWQWCFFFVFFILKISLFKSNNTCKRHENTFYKTLLNKLHTYISCYVWSDKIYS